MTPRENVLAALSRRQPDEIPIEFDCTPDLARRLSDAIGTNDFATYFRFPMRGVWWGRTKQQADFGRYFPHPLPPGTYVSEWGNAEMPGTFYHFTRKAYPMAGLTSLVEFEEYPFPDTFAEYRHSHLESLVASIHAEGWAAVAGMECTIFEQAWYMRSMELLLTDQIERPEIAEFLLDTITEHRCFMARRYAEAGVDVIRFGDDVGTQRGMLMSPAMWRRWYKPRLAKVIRAAKDVKPSLFAFYHSDGKIDPILEDLIEIGVDVLNPVQPECMDPVALKERYGNRLALWGTIGTQTTMPFGTPDEVRRVVRERISTVGRGGGLVLAPTHVLEPEVPVENVLAFVEAAREG
jgi:uroporphyrinogen decarboxylase